jgi:hypothetical protein
MKHALHTDEGNIDQALGVELPQGLLLRADEVIE